MGNWGLQVLDDKLSSEDNVTNNDDESSNSVEK